MLTIVTGPARSGKSSMLLDQIIRNAADGIEGQLLLTPANFSHETERRLAAVGGPSICRYAEVLSFSRLATRVFSAEGGLCRQILDSGGRILSMSLALETVRSRLRLYGAASARPAFYTDLLSIIDEIKNYAVTAEQLHAAAADTGGSLAVKLADLALILESYDAVCAQGKADPRDMMALLADKLSESRWAEGRIIFIDGFSCFTKLELRVLEALLGKCSAMVVTLTCDNLHGTMPVYDSVRRTAETLQLLAVHTGRKVRIEQYTDPPQIRPPFQYLRENLFASESDPYAMPAPELTLLQAEGLREECQTAVRRILDLVQGGARYSDIAIAVADRESYGPVLEGICAQYGVPVYLSGTRSILHRPVITCLLSALSAASGGMETEDVLRYLKTGLSPADPDICDALENYALVWNLRGSRWSVPFKAHPDGYGKELDEQARKALERLNAGRAAAVVPLLNLQTALRAARDTGELVLALYRFIEEIGLEPRLEQQARKLYSADRAQEAAECVQLYGIVTSALEQFYSVLGQTHLQPAAFCRLLELQLSQYTVGTIPVAVDTVLCGTISDLRNRAPQHLLVLGACDGLFPAASYGSTILSAADRQRLEQYDISLAPGPEEQLNQEMACILEVLSSPEQTLQISCHAGSEPAFLFSRLRELFPESEIQAHGWELELYREHTAAALVARRSQESDWEFLSELCSSMPRIAELADGLHKRALQEPGSLPAKTVEHLWEFPIRLSASRLESYASCHYQFFLDYGLKVKKYERAAFDAPAFGTFVHYILENVVRDVMTAGGFREISPEQLHTVTEQHIARYTAEEMNSLENQEAHFKYLYNRNLNEVRRIIPDLADELRLSDFQPTDYELHFGKDTDMPPYTVNAGGTSGEITGFVDRVDRFSHDGIQYFRIIDYKTGKKSFSYTDIYHGLGLQMLIYMFALQNACKDKDDESVFPAGVLYMPARSGILTKSERQTSEDAEKAWKKEQKRSGILLNEPLVLEAMEHCDHNGSPRYLPYTTVRSTGERKGDLMSREQLAMLQRHVNRKLSELLSQMANGQVSPNPYDKGSLSACSWCDYASICHPDDSCRRYFAKRDAEKFWKDLDYLEEMEGQHG